MDVGVEINKYKVIEHIGRGGMADVWSARDTGLNRMVAIKTIAHGLSQEADPVNLFNQEAQTIANMEHPHILPIYDFGEFEGQLYIVMRYVSGGSLEDVLNRGTISLAEALRYGQAMAQALDYAHSENVIHLDLKPSNVLLDSHKSPYLADFGLATKLDPQGKANNPGSGTLLYMAPEQLTSEVIDKRADIYSFAVMMFHILTGQLPFDAATPLALRQVQYKEPLPPLEALNEELPPQFTEILRRATAIEPDKRFTTITDMIEQMREIVTTGTGTFLALGAETGAGVRFGDVSDLYSYLTNPNTAQLEGEVLEAVDLYSRARYSWSGGKGRFLLGVTNFMLMSGYYMEPERYGLELDLEGRQMLLRGALEYDHEPDYWWDQLDDDNRRWVCLHAIRSGNAPARVRALYRLETLPDADNPQIPKLVAQALQSETNREARMAALQVLGTRAKLMKRPQQFDIKTEYRGRMLTTMTRLGVQISAPSDWQEVVYTPEIDLLIAETTLDYQMPAVAELAGRVVGRMRSTTAVRYIVNQRKAGRRHALRALAFVRDEAPNLPDVVDWQGRLYAWGTNTLIRMFDEPIRLVYRYVAALVLAWIAMGLHIAAVTTSFGGLLNNNRFARIVAVGLIFGVIAGFVPVFSDEFNARLRRFWPWWARAVGGFITGMLWGALAWTAWIWFFLAFTPSRSVVFFGGALMALGYVLTGLFRLRSWLSVPITAALIYTPIYITWQVGALFQDMLFFEFSEALLYYDTFAEGGDPRIFTVAIPFAILMAIGGHLPVVLADLRRLIAMLRRMSRTEEAGYIPPAVPDVGEYMQQPAVANLHGAPYAETELDQELGGLVTETEIGPGKLPQETEINVTELETQADVRQNRPNVTEIDLDLGIESPVIDDKTPQKADNVTELDIQASPFAPLDPNVETGAVRSYETELDVNQGKNLMADRPKPDDQPHEDEVSPFAAMIPDNDEADDDTPEDEGDHKAPTKPRYGTEVDPQANISPFTPMMGQTGGVKLKSGDDDGDPDDGEPEQPAGDVSPFAAMVGNNDDDDAGDSGDNEVSPFAATIKTTSPVSGGGGDADDDETTRTERDVTRRTVRMNAKDIEEEIDNTIETDTRPTGTMEAVPVQPEFMDMVEEDEDESDDSADDNDESSDDD